MSKRAEEAARRAYPADWVAGYFDDPDETTDDNEEAREYYQEGYEQAEKVLALTWEDIQTIDNIVVDMARNTDWPLRGQEVFYTEVLRRFHESKEK